MDKFTSGRIVGADNKIHNIVDILQGQPLSDVQQADITKLKPHSDMIIGEDNKAYSLKHMLENVGSAHEYDDTELRRLIAGKADTVHVHSQYATTAYVDEKVAEAASGGAVDLSAYARLDSPTFTGTPTAPDPTQAGSIATKAYVDAAIKADMRPGDFVELQVSVPVSADAVIATESIDLRYTNTETSAEGGSVVSLKAFWIPEIEVDLSGSMAAGETLQHTKYKLKESPSYNNTTFSNIYYRFDGQKMHLKIGYVKPLSVTASYTVTLRLVRESGSSQFHAYSSITPIDFMAWTKRTGEYSGSILPLNPTHELVTYRDKKLYKNTLPLSSYMQHYFSMIGRPAAESTLQKIEYWAEDAGYDTQKNNEGIVSLLYEMQFTADSIIVYTYGYPLSALTPGIALSFRCTYNNVANSILQTNTTQGIQRRITRNVDAQGINFNGRYLQVLNPQDGEWEWEDPPVVLHPTVLYPTTRRYEGKKVYACCDNYSGNPSANRTLVLSVPLSTHLIIDSKWRFVAGANNVINIFDGYNGYCYWIDATANAANRWRANLTGPNAVATIKLITYSILRA